jgi:hypothetical protein
VRKSRGRSDLGCHQALGKWTCTLLLSLLGGVWNQLRALRMHYAGPVVLARRQMQQLRKMQPLRIVALPLLLILARQGLCKTQSICDLGSSFVWVYAPEPLVRRPLARACDTLVAIFPCTLKRSS